ncbi:MAG: 1,4-dihydroxy-2-naphthoate polyprenyltransferase [bacterium]|nr:1,4-dihydroxy-2-naphthoate polyprenyltransferase [bacterium]MCY3580869.1 1,4-dihydroxy-2-naphthoate polyprenyltransferase [bacterium]MDE0644407.1 1,4-dihydroxy-2-naphthoate polyprenyltransferase [bacterium]MYD04084.1 1,4-dihydroxy-2-naphthoate polyprenyltransferase [Acidimicrobiia bacterium]
MTNPSVNPWVLAARPRTLWAAIAPVIVGTGSAIGDQVFRADALAAALVCALALQVAVNFANDASDARRGADSDSRIGPTRVVAAGLLPARSVWIGVVVTLGIASICGFYIAAITTWWLLAVGVAAIIAALTYTGGPVPYGYRGWGEVSVFVFFGLMATVGSRFAHDGTGPAEAWLLALPVGFTVTAILVVNNLRDIDTDAAVGKRTLAVLLGRPGTRLLYTALIGGAFGLVAIWAALGFTPPWTGLALLSAPMAIPLIRTVRSASADDGPALIRVLENTARLHFLMGVGLGLGAALG